MVYRSRERIKKILSHLEADRVPYFAIGGEILKQFVNQENLAEEHQTLCLEGDFVMITNEPEVIQAKYEKYSQDWPPQAKLSYWGIGKVELRTAEGWLAGYQYYHPLAEVNTLADLKKYPFPEILGFKEDIELEAKIEHFKRQEYTVLGQMSQTILETAYRMRGIPQLMIDFYERPDYLYYLFEQIAERRIYQARHFAEAGVDILRIGDDIATQESLLISPEMYRQRIKPFHKKIVMAAREVNPEIQVKYHSDGNLTPLLRDLLDIGVTIINPVQPECMELLSIKREYGKDLTLWGCIPVQSIIANGTYQDVAKHLDFLMDKIAINGGLVIKFTNFLATEQSLKNLEYFLLEFYEKGKYN